MPSKVWNEITFLFPNFNHYAVEVCKWINNFIPHFIMDVSTCPFLGLELIHVSKRDPWPSANLLMTTYDRRFLFFLERGCHQLHGTSTSSEIWYKIHIYLISKQTRMQMTMVCSSVTYTYALTLIKRFIGAWINNYILIIAGVYITGWWTKSPLGLGHG